MATAKTGATPRLKKILAGRGASIDAQGLRQPGGAGADGAREGSFLGSRVLLSRSAGRSVEVVVVGRRRAVPVRQAAGARTLHLAARRAGRGGADAGAAIDAAGRYRLAAAGSYRSA